MLEQSAPPRFSASMLPPDADPSETELVRLLERALAPSFTLVRRLGAGGMGTVYVARDPVLKRLVAVKVMSPALAADPDARARFEREAQAVASITHPNVVAVYSVGALENGVPFLVMQYVEGRTMAERIAADGPLDARSAKRLLGEVASALAAAHRKGIIHRDIKPANVLWDDDLGRALVTDFGIAAVLERDDQGRDATQLTHTGVVVGTPAYMSPEQLLDERVTEKTDIYSLGLLGYELLIGQGPYDIKSPREVMAAHLRDQPRRLSVFRADVDPELERLLESCLAKDPAARPSAREVEGRLLHGASVLLEWPPPGLEHLALTFRRSIQLLGLGAALFGVPIVLVAALDRQSYLRELLPPVEFAVAVALIGLVIFVGGCVRTARFAGVAARWIETGYHWGTIAEAAADWRGDTGALIAGAREYATLTPRQRSWLRLQRVVIAALLAAAALMPVLGLAIAVAAAARGPNGPSVAVWMSIIVTLAMLAIAGALAWSEHLRLRPVRTRRRALSSVSERPSELARSWTGTFDQVRGGQFLGSGLAGRRGALLATTLGVTALAVFAAGAGALLLVMTSVFEIVGGAAMLRAPIREKVTRIARLSAYRVPVDSSVSPLRAGQALHSIIRAGGAPPMSRWEGPPALGIPAFRPPDAIPFADKSALSDAFRQAARGFTDAQRRYLQQAAANPALVEFRLAASAPSLDLIGAMWSVPPDARVQLHELPVPRLAVLRTAALSNTARAALDLAAGESRDAERRLREIISVGYLLLRDGHSSFENLVGANIMSAGRVSLEALYETVGRRAEARFVSQASDPTSGATAVPETRPRVPIDELERTTRRFVLDTSEVRGTRWDMLAFLSILPCADMHQVVFGLDAASRAVLDSAQATLVRTRSDSLHFALIERASDHPRMLRNGEPLMAPRMGPVARLVTAITGHRAFQACTVVLGRR